MIKKRRPYDPGVEITGAPSGAEVLRGAKKLEEKAARLAGKEEAPKHPRWLRKLRTSALAGGVGSGLTAALGYVSPSVLASVGIANPWVAAALMAGVTAVQGVVGYYTKSDPRDFPKAEAMPAEEVRRLLEEQGSKEVNSSIQSEPKPSPKHNSSPMEDTDALKSGITAAVEVVEVGIRVGSDGFQVKDLGVVITDQELRDKLTAFLDKADEIPAEIADLKGGEVLELAMHAFSETQRLFA